ncbi:MAG: hypothetical protein IJ638_03180 [Alphaproteobacteria bacterium]|nr:hypothetical protein [Alphaproteobacteria bacterium]
MNNNDYLNYNKMLDKALVSVVKNALEQASFDGLLDGHYFYLSFKTNFNGVVVPEFLKKQYPDTLTIVIQHEYSNLSVSEKEFGVTLSFNNYNYHIIVPFNSLVAFSDPAVNFSLSFNPVEDENVIEEEKEPELSYTDDDSNIISMSAFMKNSSPNDDDVA